MSVNKNILQELKEIVPGFQWPENHPDFEVPEGYFTQFPDAVLNKINNGGEKELSVSFTKKNIYEAPAGYFDSLPEKVLSKVNRESKGVQVMQLPRRHRNWYNWATAAVIAAFVALGGVIWLTPPPVKQQSSFSINQQLASLSDQEIEQYLSVQINSSNVNEVYDNLSDQDLQNVLTNGLSTAAIEEYLQNNAPDTSSF